MKLRVYRLKGNPEVIVQSPLICAAFYFKAKKGVTGAYWSQKHFYYELKTGQNAKIINKIPPISVTNN